MNYATIFSIIAMLIPILATGMQTPVSVPYAQTHGRIKPNEFNSAITVFDFKEKIKKKRTKQNKALDNQDIELRAHVNALLEAFDNSQFENATIESNIVESEYPVPTVAVDEHLPVEELGFLSEVHNFFDEENMQTSITPAQSSTSNIENSEPVAHNTVNTLQPRVKKLIQLTKHHKKDRLENKSISHFKLSENYNAPIRKKRTRRILKQRPADKSIFKFSLNQDQ